MPNVEDIIVNTRLVDVFEINIWRMTKAQSDKRQERKEERGSKNLILWFIV